MTYSEPSLTTTSLHHTTIHTDPDCRVGPTTQRGAAPAVVADA